nr:DUF6199 family natural product biosynthesis protein [uncultured Dysosmobacter sp.]
MRRTACFWLILALCLFLTGCGSAHKEPTSYEVDGFTIDKEAQTVTKGEDVYHYTISGSKVTILYPNGAEYWWNYGSGDTPISYGGWSDNYDPARYVSGDRLLDLINYKAPSPSGRSNGIGFLLAVIGLFNLLAPRASWYLSYGWRFKDAEPSEAALVLGRVGGGFAVLAGLLMIF